MTSSELANRPASIVRNYTQQVRDHTAAMQRLQDQYFAALKRAEAQYFEGVKKITDALTRDTEVEAVADTKASNTAQTNAAPQEQVAAA